MNIGDNIRVSDAGLVRAGSQSRAWGSERSVVEVHGWVRMVLRERGKKITEREGHNVWTNTGREFLSQRMTLDLANPSTTLRTDAVAYIGVGTGSQPEEPGVLQLANPVEYDQGLFLADIRAVEFPIYPVRTTVEYRRVFDENEINLLGTTVLVSELGLFTNGDPNANPAYGFGTRDRGVASFAAAPVAYKGFEPFGKTSAMQLETYWQIRF